MKKKEKFERLSEFLSEISDNSVINSTIVEIIEIQDKVFTDTVKKKKILEKIQHNVALWK